MDDSRYVRPPAPGVIGADKTDFSLYHLVDASCENGLIRVSKEMEYLYDDPEAYGTAPLAMEGPIAEESRTRAAIFHTAMRFGIEYERRYPVEMCGEWRGYENEDAAQIPKNTTRRPADRIEALPNNRMQEIISACRKNEKREIADEFGYILAHPAEFEAGDAISMRVTRPITSLGGDPPIVLHLGLLFGMLFKRNHPDVSVPRWGDQSVPLDFEMRST